MSAESVSSTRTHVHRCRDGAVRTDHVATGEWGENAQAMWPNRIEYMFDCQAVSRVKICGMTQMCMAAVRI